MILQLLTKLRKICIDPGIVYQDYKGTIEEKILELQEKKKKLSDKLIDENKQDTSFQQLTEEDIKNLLTYEK